MLAKWSIALVMAFARVVLTKSRMFLIIFEGIRVTLIDRFIAFAVVKRFNLVAKLVKPVRPVKSFVAMTFKAFEAEQVMFAELASLCEVEIFMSDMFQVVLVELAVLGVVML